MFRCVSRVRTTVCDVSLLFSIDVDVCVVIPVRGVSFLSAEPPIFSKRTNQYPVHVNSTVPARCDANTLCPSQATSRHAACIMCMCIHVQ